MAPPACSNFLKGYPDGCPECAAMETLQSGLGMSTQTDRPQQLTIPPNGAQGVTSNTISALGLLEHDPNTSSTVPTEAMRHVRNLSDYLTEHLKPASPAIPAHGSQTRESDPAHGYQMRKFLRFEAGKETVLTSSLVRVSVGGQGPLPPVHCEPAALKHQIPSAGTRDVHPFGQSHGTTANDQASDLHRGESSANATAGEDSPNHGDQKYLGHSADVKEREHGGDKK